MELITPLQLTASELADRARRLAWVDARNRVIDANLKGDAVATQVAHAQMFELELDSEDWEAC